MWKLDWIETKQKLNMWLKKKKKMIKDKIKNPNYGFLGMSMLAHTLSMCAHA